MSLWGFKGWTLPFNRGRTGYTGLRSVSTSIPESLRTFDRSASSSDCTISALPAGTLILLRVPDAHGTTMGLPETWYLITRIGSVRSGPHGEVSTVVSATKCTTEYAVSPVRATVDN